MGEGIDDQFRDWVEERKLDAKARAAGMTRIEKEVEAGNALPARLEAFRGRRIAQIKDTSPGNEAPEIREVYATRRGHYVLWWSTKGGRRVIELCEAPDALDALWRALGRYGWGDLRLEVEKALEREAIVKDW